MSDDLERRMRLDLSAREALIVAAALRQYEPYWSPNDADAAAKLSDLVADIRRLLKELESGAPQSVHRRTRQTFLKVAGPPAT